MPARRTPRNSPTRPRGSGVAYVCDGPPMTQFGDGARIALAAAIGVAYFLVARLSVGLVLEPEGVAVFWPAAGITSGSLIVLGPRALWPTAVGVISASVAVH